MHRIVEINSQLSSIVARQDRELASILTPAQRASLSQMVKTAQSSM
jgi:hypothetical protein